MNIALAPMDWVTDTVYRQVCKQVFEQSQPNDNLLLYSEFMSADGFFHSPKWVWLHIIHSGEKPIMQIFGWNEETLVFSAKKLDQYEWFSWIELNIGCPSPKIMACWAWSWMLLDKKNTLKIIESMAKSIKKPFSIKTRIWLNVEDMENQKQFILDAAPFCESIALHWRTYKQSHSWDVNWDFIYEIKNLLPQKKIIWNGWVKNFADAQQKIWNLDAIMIGQAAIGNPWSLVENEPSIEDKKNTILHHLDLSAWLEQWYKDTIVQNENLPELWPMPTQQELKIFSKKNINWKAAIEFRKYLFAYISGLEWSKDFKKKIPAIREYQLLRDEIEIFFNWLENSR